MRKSRIAKVIALALTLSMILGVNAFADSHSIFFDFEQMTLRLAPGDVYKDFDVYVDNWYNPNYSVYIVGNTDPKTYVWGDFKTGYSKLDIFIGPNETAKQITLYFYVDELDCHDDININIVSPECSDIPETRVKAFKDKEAKAAPVETVAPSPMSLKEAQKLFKENPKTDEELAVMPESERLKYYYAALAIKQAGK